MHSRGETAESPYTSWTRRLEIAEWHAGVGGVILEWELGEPPAGAAWSWEWSPDPFLEGEVLIRGAIHGATVIQL
jgi:hypothetical protein